MEKNKKILYVIICIIIIIGAIVWKKSGFKFDLLYSNRSEIAISNNTSLDKNEIENIAKEVLNGKVIVQDVEIFNNYFTITAHEITEEQRNSIVEKLNEKFSIDLEAENVNIININQIRIKDMLKPYILPTVIVSAIILLYFIIRFRKLNIQKVLAKSILVIILSELLILSICAICRIPMGVLTEPIMIAVYAIATVLLTISFEAKNTELEEKKSIEKNN